MLEISWPWDCATARTMLPYRNGRQVAAFGSSKKMVPALESPAGVAVPGCHYSTPPCLLVPPRHSEALGVAEG